MIFRVSFVPTEQEKITNFDKQILSNGDGDDDENGERNIEILKYFAHI